MRVDQEGPVGSQRIPRVAVVILNWNGAEFLRRFLSSVVENSTAEDAHVEVIVADNGSTDDSLEWLKANMPQVRVIELPENYGFTGGYNRALRQVESDYYLLLNSDIEVTPQWLEPLVSAMEADKHIAAAMPKIKSWSEPTKFEYAGASGGFIDTLGYPFCRGRLVSITESDTGQYDTPREIFWATGAAMMVRASLYHSSGGLDENFFAHMEEIDLCWRLRRQGYSIAVVPQSVVYHVGAGTLPVWSPRKTYLNFRNNIAMLYKNLSRPRFIFLLPLRMATDSARLVTYLMVGKWSFALAIFNGHRDFWRMRSKLDRQPQFGFGRVGQIYKGSIVFRCLFVSKWFGKMM